MDANEEPKIEVKTVIAVGGSQGCDSEDFLGYTLCLRPVKGFQYANNKNYRTEQEEAKTLIKQEGVIRQLQEIKREWSTTTSRRRQEDNEIPAILTNIKENINVVKTEDLKPFSNFRQIKKEWNIMTRQIKDLRLSTAKSASEEKIKHIGAQLDESRQQRDLIAQKIQNNKISIDKIVNKTNNQGENEEESMNTENENEDNERDGQDREEGYFQQFYRKWKTQQQSL